MLPGCGAQVEGELQVFWVWQALLGSAWAIFLAKFGEGLTWV